MDEDEFHQQKIFVSKDLLKLESVNHNEILEEICTIKEKKPLANDSRKTFKVPQSSVLAQVKKFLPHIDAANKDLQNVPACTINMEEVDDADQVIEMNLAVVEQSNDIDTESESDTDTDTDSSSDSDCCIMGEVTAENLKLAKHAGSAKGTLIQEINSNEISILNKDNFVEKSKDLYNSDNQCCNHDASKIT